MHVQGYMATVDFDDGVLTIRGRNKMSRFAASKGLRSPERDKDADTAALQERMEEVGMAKASAEFAGEVMGQLGDEVHGLATDDVVIRREDIAAVEMAKANMIKNGCLTITTKCGDVHKVHFRRKQVKEFDALVSALS